MAPSPRTRRRGFFLLDLLLFLAVAGVIYLCVSEGVLGEFGIGWGKAERRTLRRLAQRGAPTLVVFYGDT